jgi:hypothetical protein
MRAWRAASPSNDTVVRAPRLTERIRLLDLRLRQALPEELTDDDRAALQELLETLRALAEPKPPPPGPADPHSNKT